MTETYLPALEATETETAYLAGAFDARGSVSVFTAGGGTGVRLAIDSKEPSRILQAFFGDPTLQGGYTSRVWRYQVTSRVECRRLARLLNRSPYLSAQNALLLGLFYTYCATASSTDRAYLAEQIKAARGEARDAREAAK